VSPIGTPDEMLAELVNKLVSKGKKGGESKKGENTE
jgi:hypothetical protein